MINEVISASVPANVAKQIKDLAAKEDRSVSYIAGRILKKEVGGRQAPEVKFVRRGAAVKAGGRS